MPALGKETVKENSTEGLEQLDFFAVMATSGSNLKRAVLRVKDEAGTESPGLIIEEVSTPATAGAAPTRVADTAYIEALLSDLVVDGTPRPVKFREINVAVDGNCNYYMMVLCSAPYLKS